MCNIICITYYQCKGRYKKKRRFTSTAFRSTLSASASVGTCKAFGVELEIPEEKHFEKRPFSLKCTAPRPGPLPTRAGNDGT